MCRIVSRYADGQIIGVADGQIISVADGQIMGKPDASVNAPCTNTVMYLRYRDSIAYTTEMTPFYIYCCNFNECIPLLYVQSNVHNDDTPCTFLERIMLKVTVKFQYTFIVYNFPVLNRAEFTISYGNTDE